MKVRCTGALFLFFDRGRTMVPICPLSVPPPLRAPPRLIRVDFIGKSASSSLLQWVGRSVFAVAGGLVFARSASRSFRVCGLNGAARENIFAFAACGLRLTSPCLRIGLTPVPCLWFRWPGVPCLRSPGETVLVFARTVACSVHVCGPSGLAFRVCGRRVFSRLRERQPVPSVFAV